MKKEDKKDNLIDEIRFDFWNKLIEDEQKIYNNQYTSELYRICIDEFMLQEIFDSNTDVWATFRGEEFFIFIDDLNSIDFTNQDYDATVICITFERKLKIINERHTTAEKIFIEVLFKILKLIR